VQLIESPVRRDFYIWLALTGCRSGETSTMQWEQVDLKKGIVRYPITKTEEFELPLSDFLVDLLQKRKACKETTKLFGANCPWVFPSVDAEKRPSDRAEVKQRRERTVRGKMVSPHTLRHSWITASKNKVKIPAAHSSMLTNHKTSVLDQRRRTRGIQSSRPGRPAQKPAADDGLLAHAG